VLYARATAVVVMVDAVSGRPVRLTEAMREAWEPYPHHDLLSDGPHLHA
jgi:acyl-CoA thioester hydrolase